MTMRDKTNWQCFYPAFGIAFGFGFGILMAVFFPDGWSGEWQGEVAPRLWGLVASLIGWAMAVVGQGKSVHCGGTRDVQEQSDRYAIKLAGVVLLLMLMLAGYVLGGFFLFSLSAIAIISLFIGEIGWGNPFRLITAVTTKLGKG